MMDANTYLQLHERLCTMARELTKAKGHDYSGEVDTLANLKLPDLVQLCPAEIGVAVRLGDKYSRMCRLVAIGNENRTVKDETLLDTIIDTINYSILLAAVLVEKGKLEVE